MDKKNIIRSNEGTQAIINYEPKEFASLVAEVAHDFVATQEQGTDFVISEEVANKSGVSELNRQSMEDLVEQKALEKLKDVEEMAYKEAYDLGLIEGTEKAFIERKEEFAEQLSNFDLILKNLDVIQKILVAKSESEIMQVVNLIASRVAKKEIEADRELILPVIKEVLEYLDKGQDIVIKMSSEDSLFIESVRGKLNKEVDKFDRVKIETVDKISSGGCVVETDFGVIDATVEERINRIWQTIEQRLPKVQKGEVFESKSDEDEGATGLVGEETSDEASSSTSEDPDDDSGDTNGDGA